MHNIPGSRRRLTIRWRRLCAQTLRSFATRPLGAIKKVSATRNRPHAFQDAGVPRKRGVVRERVCMTFPTGLLRASLFAALVGVPRFRMRAWLFGLGGCVLWFCFGFWGRLVVLVWLNRNLHRYEILHYFLFVTPPATHLVGPPHPFKTRLGDCELFVKPMAAQNGPNTT